MSDEIIDHGRRAFFKESFSYFGNAVSEIVKNKVETITKNSPGSSSNSKVRKYIRLS
jgi:hypothetical protein